MPNPPKHYVMSTPRQAQCHVRSSITHNRAVGTTATWGTLLGAPPACFGGFGDRDGTHPLGTRISQLLAAGQCVYYNPHFVIFWRIRRTVEDATQAFNDGISAN